MKSTTPLGSGAYADLDVRMYYYTDTPPPPPLQVSVTPGIGGAGLPRGSEVSFSVLASTNRSGVGVSLYVPQLPPGVTATFSPSTAVPGWNYVARIQVAINAALGNYKFRVCASAQDGGTTSIACTNDLGLTIRQNASQIMSSVNQLLLR